MVVESRTISNKCAEVQQKRLKTGDPDLHMKHCKMVRKAEESDRDSDTDIDMVKFKSFNLIVSNQ